MTTTETGIVELKPCPFCGVEIHEVPVLGSEEEKVLVHEGNRCVLELCHIPKDKTAAWNTRAAIAAMPDTQVPADVPELVEVEELADAIWDRLPSIESVVCESDAIITRAQLGEAMSEAAAAALQSQSQLLQTMASALERLVGAMPVVVAYGEHPMSDCNCPFCGASAALAQYREQRS